MFGLSMEHILIFGVVMLLFGAKRLPELGAGLGNGIKAFKQAMDGNSDKAETRLISHTEKEAGSEKS